MAPSILSPDRTAWREAVAEIAEKARQTLPECNGRVEKAVTLVLAGDVELLHSLVERRLTVVLCAVRPEHAHGDETSAEYMPIDAVPFDLADRRAKPSRDNALGLVVIRCCAVWPIYPLSQLVRFDVQVVRVYLQVVRVCFSLVSHR